MDEFGGFVTMQELRQKLYEEEILNAPEPRFELLDKSAHPKVQLPKDLIKGKTEARTYYTKTEFHDKEGNLRRKSSQSKSNAAEKDWYYDEKEQPVYKMEWDYNESGNLYIREEWFKNGKEYMSFYSEPYRLDRISLCDDNQKVKYQLTRNSSDYPGRRVLSYQESIFNKSDSVKEIYKKFSADKKLTNAVIRLKDARFTYDLNSGDDQ